MSELLLHGGRPWGTAEAADLLVRDGVIARIAPGIEAAGAEVVDLAGRLLLPGLVDAHTHLDKTLCGGPWVPHTAGDALADRIANERRRRFELGLPTSSTRPRCSSGWSRRARRTCVATPTSIRRWGCVA